MVVGVLGAAAQTGFRKILSFHIVSQIGYMVLGRALMTPLAPAGAVFYLIHHIVVKANLFLIAGVAKRIAGSTGLARIGGLYATAPLLAALFVVPAFSLAGFPSLSGFWAKFLIVKVALEVEAWIVAAAFWRPHPEGREPRLSSLAPAERRTLIWPIAGLAGLTVAIGLAPEPFVTFAETAAAQLPDPTAYVGAVL